MQAGYSASLQAATATAHKEENTVKGEQKVSGDMEYPAGVSRKIGSLERQKKGKAKGKERILACLWHAKTQTRSRQRTNQ